MDGYEPSLRPNLNGYDAFDTKAVEVRLRVHDFRHCPRDYTLNT